METITVTQPVQIFKTEDKAATQKTADGFQNFAAKLGVSPQGESGSNILSHGHYQFNLVTRNRLALEAAYRGSWIVGKSIDIPAEDMTRAGIDIVTNEGAEQVQELKVQMSRLKIWNSLCNNIKWGDLYGGSLGVIQIKGQQLNTPLDLDTIGEGQFQGIVVYDRWQLNPSLGELIESGPDLGLPKYYDIVLGNNLNDPGQANAGQKAQATGQVRVHYSRCIRAIGHQLPFFQAITEMMWGESRLERMWDRLIEYDDAIASTGGLINRAQLRSVGIDGLREILAAGGQAQEALIAQFEYMRQFQTNEGITLLDKLDTFSTAAYSFGGLSDVLGDFKEEVSGGFDIPLVRMFGQMPKGLSGNAESDLKLYYDGINSKQEYNLRNPMEMILKCMWRSLFGKPIPKDLTFTFTPLFQMTAKEKSDVGKTNADTVIEAHQEGLVSTVTAMKELKKNSQVTGVFTHISDEEIEEAENDEPPMPETPREALASDPVDPPHSEKIAAATKTGDSAWKRIKRWLSVDADFKEDDHPRKKDGKFGEGGAGSTTQKKSEESESKSESLDTTEIRALSDYGENAHSAINKILRGEDMSDRNVGFIKNKKEQIKQIDSAFKKAPALKKDTTVYRGMSNAPEFSKMGEKAVGKEIKIPSYWSTSKDASYGDSFSAGENAVVFKIKVPQGTKAIDMHEATGSSTAKREQELLLNRDSKFKITKVSKDSKGTTLVELELING